MYIKLQNQAHLDCCAIDMIFDKIYLDKNDKMSVFKRQKINLKHQFVSVLRDISNLPEVVQPCSSSKSTLAEKVKVQTEDHGSEDDFKPITVQKKLQ